VWVMLCSAVGCLCVVAFVMKRDDDWPEEKPCKLKNMVNPQGGQKLAEKEGMRERRERNGEPFLIPLTKTKDLTSDEHVACRMQGYQNIYYLVNDLNLKSY